jgi:hypothetical protein
MTTLEALWGSVSEVGKDQSRFTGYMTANACSKEPHNCESVSIHIRFLLLDIEIEPTFVCST